MSLVLTVLATTALAPIDARTAYDRAQAGVVTVRAGESVGSGFVVADGTLVVTCNHVIKDDPASVTVRGQAAKVLAQDADVDVAILRVSRRVGTPLRLASALPKPGTKVYAIGTPLGVLDKSISEGIVSAVRQVKQLRLLQITAPISQGNSGGPVVDDRGQVLGMAALYLREGQALNFAIAAPNIRTVLAAAQATSKPVATYARLGYTGLRYSVARSAFTIRDRPNPRAAAMGQTTQGETLFVKKTSSPQWLAMAFAGAEFGYVPSRLVDVYGPVPASVLRKFELEDKIQRLIKLAIESDEAAISRLVILGEPAATAILLKMVKNDREPDRFLDNTDLGRILGRMRDKAKGPMLTAWNTGNPGLRKAVIVAIGAMLFDKYLDEQVGKPSGETYGRTPALQALLPKALEDPLLATEAAEAMGYSRDREHMAGLIKLSEHEDRELAEAGFHGLLHLSGVEDVRTLREIFDHLLERTTEEEASKVDNPFIESLLFPTTTARENTANSFLADLLNHEDPSVRRAACRFLVQVANEWALSRLEPRLNDTEPAVRRVALDAVAQLGKGKVHLNRMLEAAKAADEFDRGWAVTALGHTGLKSVIPTLAEMVFDPSLFVRESVVLALSEFSTPEARAALKKMENDPTPSIRRAARRALQGS